MLGRLHHVGFVVASIPRALPGFLDSLGASCSGEIVHDPLQKVNVIFLRAPAVEPVLIELVEPAGPDSPVQRFLKKGGGLNHTCYEVQDLDAEMGRLKRLGAVVVSEPKPAAAFAERRVAWVMTQEWMLLELLET